MPHRDGNRRPARMAGNLRVLATRPSDAGEPRACQPEPLRCPADGAGLASAFGAYPLRPGCGDHLRPCVSGVWATQGGRASACGVLRQRQSPGNGIIKN